MIQSVKKHHIPASKCNNKKSKKNSRGFLRSPVVSRAQQTRFEKNIKHQFELDTAWGEVLLPKQTASFKLEQADYLQDKLSMKLRKTLKNRKIASFQIQPLQRFTATLQNSVKGSPTESLHVPADLGEVVGWDTEYRTILDKSNTPVGNMILSYQFWSYNFQSGLILIPLDGEQVPFSILRDLVFFWLRGLGSKDERISLVAHFTLAECASSRMKDALPEMDTMKVIQKSFVAIRPSKIETWDSSRNRKSYMLSLHDTLLLSGFQPLKGIAGNVGLEKLDLSGGDWIERMDELMVQNSRLYIDYSMMDSIITSSYFVKFIKQARKMVGDDVYVPATVSGLSAKYVESRLNSMSEEGVRVLSPREKEQFCIKSKNGSLRTKKIEQIPEQVWRNVIALHGGRNETFRFGLLEKGAYDYDLAGAYATAMLSLADVDWSDAEQVSSVEDVKWNDIGYAKVEFSFRKGCYFPIFPSSCFEGGTRVTDFGLCFPRKGVTYVSFPELFVAREMGVLEKCEIKDSLRFRKKSNSSLSNIVKDLILERSSHPKGSFSNTLYKLLCNSIFGKICQGLSGKKGVNLQRTIKTPGCIQRDRIALSSITNPAIASYITGMVRASVGEYLIALDQAGRAQDIVNVTTDGFMITREKLPDSWLYGENLPLSQNLSETRAECLGKEYKDVLELKHWTDNFSWAAKTRNYSMLPGSQSSPLLFAKSGVSFKGQGLTREEELKRLTSMFLENVGEYNSSHLVSISDYISGKADALVSLNSTRSKNWDYDLKRKPVEVVTKNITWLKKEYAVPCFHTRPWETSFDFLASRRAYDSWKKSELLNLDRKNNNKLNTEADIRQFLNYFEEKMNSPTNRAESFRKSLRKIFVYALSKQGWSAAQISKTLGFDRKECNSIRRGKIYERCISGKTPLKRISEGVWEHNVVLIIDLFSKLPKDISQEVSSEISPAANFKDK